MGAGYASLRHLTVLPVTCVEVDRSSTARLGLDAVSTTLVHSVVRLAGDLGIDCVVEGVETPQQRAALGSSPHLLLQGYLIGVPAPLPAG